MPMCQKGKNSEKVIFDFFVKEFGKKWLKSSKSRGWGGGARSFWKNTIKKQLILFEGFPKSQMGWHMKRHKTKVGRTCWEISERGPRLCFLGARFAACRGGLGKPSKKKTVFYGILPKRGGIPPQNAKNSKTVIFEIFC